jgi:hypothetical protein
VQSPPTTPVNADTGGIDADEVEEEEDKEDEDGRRRRRFSVGT